MGDTWTLVRSRRLQMSVCVHLPLVGGCKDPSSFCTSNCGGVSACRWNSSGFPSFYPNLAPSQAVWCFCGECSVSPSSSPYPIPRFVVPNATWYASSCLFACYVLVHALSVTSLCLFFYRVRFTALVYIFAVSLFPSRTPFFQLLPPCRVRLMRRSRASSKRRTSRSSEMPKGSVPGVGEEEEAAN